MESKKIVVISIVSILLISIIVSIIGWNTRTYDSRLSEQECKREEKYCIFDGVPTGMMYSRTDESMKGVHEFTGNIDDYAYNLYETRGEYNPEYPERIVLPKTVEPYINPWDISSYRCKSTEEKPEVIEYFTEFCGRSNGLGGCGDERRAIVCGDGYLIQDINDYNTKLYGPYDIPESIN